MTTKTLVDGSSFKGNVNHHGVPHGYGDALYSDWSRYTGQWVNGCRHGCGRMVYADGSVFVGKWRNGFKWGKGSLTLRDGAVVTGIYINDKRIDDDE